MQTSSKARHNKAAHADCETRIFCLRERHVAKKNTAPTASTRAGHGCGGVTGSGGSLCNPGGAAQQHQPATWKSLWCSREQSTSGAAVLGGYACTSSSLVWIHTAYLHKHAGFSILPFIRGSLYLAHQPQRCQLPLAILPPAVSRAVSSFLSGHVLPLQGLIFSAKSPSASKINHCCPDSTRVSPRGRQPR